VNRFLSLGRSTGCFREHPYLYAVQRAGHERLTARPGPDRSPAPDRRWRRGAAQGYVAFGKLMNMISGEDFATEAEGRLKLGARLVGGCCGIGPEHVRLLKDRLPTRPFWGINHQCADRRWTPQIISLSLWVASPPSALPSASSWRLLHPTRPKSRPVRRLRRPPESLLPGSPRQDWSC
jgi:Homocysteine S-methyltransferase